ncbi:glycosyltransferase [uncultured Agrococcus sp.]|uniref:glycosyltransferase n=1 Tax=uncultured Agrococcus sp. TaxID=382258 RepID=UPI0025E194C7|nr:glycosyltransferase [uncultured Agrococcus sp.]
MTTSSQAKRPLRILIAGDTFAPDVNGGAKFATRLTAGLVQRGHEVHVVASALGRGKQGTRVEEHEGARFTVHRLRSILYPGHEWLRFAEPWRVKQNAASLLDALKPDVVHSQSHIIMGRAFAAEAPKRGIRLVATNHIMFENLMDHSNFPRVAHHRVAREAWRDAARVFRKCDVVTTPTRRSAEFLERNTGIADVQAISCGLNASDYTVSEQRNRHSIVFVGRVTSEKNIDVLVDAVARLPKDLDATLTVVGVGDLTDALQQQADRHGIGDRVTFTGYVTDEQLRQHLTDGAVFAMPSTAELQSIATMEAMASGLPVVGADSMALPHLIHDGDNGYLFKPGDASDLACKLERVLRASDEEYQRMRDESLHLVMDHDIERTLDAFERIYRGEE